MIKVFALLLGFAIGGGLVTACDTAPKRGNSYLSICSQLHNDCTGDRY